MLNDRLKLLLFKLNRHCKDNTKSYESIVKGLKMFMGLEIFVNFSKISK
jgi:hypothetical protein